MELCDIAVILCILLCLFITHIGRREEITLGRLYEHLKEIERQRREAWRRR